VILSVLALSIVASMVVSKRAEGSSGRAS
jgi:hypothetical protein